MEKRNFFRIIMMTMLFMGLNNAIAQTSPEEVVKQTSNEMLAALKQNKAILKGDPSKIYDLVERILVPRFDFSTISQWAMGRSWRNATPAQRNIFTDEFKRLLINSYAGSLLEYSDEKINILPSRTSSKDEVTVYSEIISSKRAPVSVTYSMIKSGNRWMVYDVTIEGVSIVSNYRAEVRELVNSRGIDGMINAISDKNKTIK